MSFLKEGLNLEGPLSEIALSLIEFDRNLLNYKPERKRIDQWLQTIKDWEIERKQQKISTFWIEGIGGAIVGALVAGLLGGIIGFIVGSKIGEASVT